MLKKLLIYIIVIINILIISYCLKETYLLETTRIINLSGESKYWLADININLPYDSNLIIRPFRDDFDIPSIIDIEIISNNKTIYTNKLEYIKDKNGYLGDYRLELNSRDYFKYNTKDLIILIKYNNETSKVLLDDREVYR